MRKLAYNSAKSKLCQNRTNIGHFKHNIEKYAIVTVSKTKTSLT